MVLQALGSVGIGMVWGWLVGSLSCREANLRRAILLVSLSTSVFVLLVLYFLGRYNLVWFTGAFLFASLMHVGWRQQLSQNRSSQFTTKEKR